MLKLNGLMMGLNIKKVSSLIRLEGEVRKDGQANGGAYPIMQFNIISVIRTCIAVTMVVTSMSENRALACIAAVYVDDATSRLMQLRFVKSESTFN